MNAERVETGTDASDWAAWRAAFEAEHGRPPRVLHIGNIANNAYNNAKVLNAAGFDCDVICHSYYHIMGCPEWEDADFRGRVGDDFYPRWHAVDLRGFRRPRWFAQGSPGVCVRYLLARRSGRRLAARWWWQVMALQRRLAGRRIFRLVRGLRERAKALQQRVENGSPSASSRRVVLNSPYQELLNTVWRLPVLLAWLPFAVSRDASRLFLRPLRRPRRPPRSLPPYDFDRRVATLVEEFERCFPDRPDRLRPEDCEGYRTTIAMWRALFSAYDLVQGYSTDPILPMLADVGDYVAYEHGTLREIPFFPTAIGRLTALSYRKAAATVITNSDCRAAALELNLERYRAVPHLIDTKYYAPRIRDSGALPPGVRQPYVFSPARHDWEIKGTEILLRAFARLAADNDELQLVTAAWGADLERSMALMQSFGLGERMTFVEPLGIHGLIRVASRAEVLVDQFRYGVFGGIGPTALAVGTPLVTHLDPEKSSWCMEPPPYFEAVDAESCYRALRAALEVDRAEHAQRQRAWMERNYWYGDVVDRHAEIYRDVLGRRSFLPATADPTPAEMR